MTRQRGQQQQWEQCHDNWRQLVQCCASVPARQATSPAGGSRWAANFLPTSIAVCTTAPSRLHTTPSANPILSVCYCRLPMLRLLGTR